MQIYVGAIDYRYAFAILSTLHVHILHLHLYCALMWSKRAYWKYEIAIFTVGTKSNAIPAQRVYKRKSRTKDSMPGEKSVVFLKKLYKVSII